MGKYSKAIKEIYAIGYQRGWNSCKNLDHSYGDMIKGAYGYGRGFHNKYKTLSDNPAYKKKKYY